MAASMRTVCRRFILQNISKSSKCRVLLAYKPTTKILQKEVTSGIYTIRSINTSTTFHNEEHLEDDDEVTEEKVEAKPVDLETAIEYIGSEEYLEKYGNKPVFSNYRRNFKGGVPPNKTRKMCIRGKGDTYRVAGNPCPLCRDDRLLLHHKNVKLLEQFVCPHSLEIYSWYRTSICQMRYKQLVKAVEEARAIGLMPNPIPIFVKYDYKDYYTDHPGVRKETTTS
ncbi:small ribosomal subunit protein mS40-like [Antedon mediterranea]|uniref:small ribosomal subunit protein mS40-like n=1 Tax=Antedon mediterranea TaxID=105859 RepID=UPI003AF8843B